VVECEDLPFLSTAVVQVLIALRRACRGRGLSLTVSGVQDTAIAYLRLAGLEDVLSA
jgi:anti-anti-sigma factor